MTFTYTYRDAQGAVRTDVVEAASRQDAFAALKARGVSPVSVKTGGTPRAAGASAPASGRPAVAKAAAVGLVVVLGAGLAWFCLKPSQEPSEAGTGRPKAVRTAPVEGTRPAGPSAAAKAADGAASVQPQAPSAGTSGAVAATDAAAAPDLPPAGTNNVPPPSLPPPVFDNASDQVLAMVAQDATHGMAPIPTGRDSEREFRESLKKEIAILDTDDEQTKALKESVIALREEIKKLLDSGMSFNQVLQEHQKLVNENAKIRNDATLELRRILESGDVEGAQKYKRKMNIALGQMGIAGISVPVTEEERAERAAARRERMLERRARQAAQAEAAEALKDAQQGK